MVKYSEDPAVREIQIDFIEALKVFRTFRDGTDGPLFDPEGQLPYRLLKMFVATLCLFLAALVTLWVCL